MAASAKLQRGLAQLWNKTAQPVNRNLKWAFVETGNLIVINQRGLAGTHVARLYQRIKRAKNHQKAVVAVARHLAEAAWWVLTRQEVYREPHGSRHVLSSTHG